MGKSKGVISNKLFKEAYKRGKSLKQSMLESGYAENTSNRGMAVKGIQPLVEQVKSEFNRSSITVDYVLKGIVDLMENPNTKSSDKVQCFNLLGKYLKLFTDQPTVQVAVFDKYASELPPLVVDKCVNSVDNSVNNDATPIDTSTNTNIE